MQKPDTHNWGAALIGMGVGMVAAALLVTCWSGVPALPGAEPMAPMITISTVMPAPPAPPPSVAPLPPSVTLVVPHGLTATEIARMMAASGVITDELEFVRKAVERGVDRVLRAGTYQLGRPSASDEVVSVMSSSRP